jgi:transposase
MTLQPRNFEQIPSGFTRIARQAFPKGNVYLKLRDELGVVYQDEQFAELFCSTSGQSGYSPGQLAMVTVMQFMEGLSDRQAAEAVRSRIDWKYLLGLPLSDEGFERSVLSEFRARLIAGGLSMLLLDEQLGQASSRGWVKARGKQRTDSTHVLAAVRQLNRVELVGETLRHRLNMLANVVPTWFIEQVDGDWFERYSMRIEQSRVAKSQAAQTAWVLQVGKDGHHLLAAIESAPNGEWLRQLPAVETLRQVWVQQSYLDGNGVHWREQKHLPPHHQLIDSPYDVEARNRTKRETNWTGYTVHLSETCEDLGVNLITHVVTPPATTGDSQVLTQIHAALTTKGLLPKEHLMDTAYQSAEHRLSSHSAGIEIIAPTAPDTAWQARSPDGVDVQRFTIDWQAQTLVCPMGHPSLSWKSDQHSRGHDIIRVCFSAKHCTPCPSRSQCPQSKMHSRTLNLLPEALHLARQTAQQQQATDEFATRYARRAGIEGTISQAVRAFDLRRTRYIGQAKTHLQNIAITTATNFTRLAAFFNGIPKAQTRVSSFAALADTGSS